MMHDLLGHSLVFEGRVLYSIEKEKQGKKFQKAVTRLFLDGLLSF